MAAILKFKMAQPGGISELGPDLKMILVGYPTHMPSFIISLKKVKYSGGIFAYAA